MLDRCTKTKSDVLQLNRKAQHFPLMDQIKPSICLLRCQLVEKRRLAERPLIFFSCRLDSMSSKALRRHDAQPTEADETFRNRLQRSETEKSKVCVSLILTRHVCKWHKYIINLNTSYGIQLMAYASSDYRWKWSVSSKLKNHENFQGILGFFQCQCISIARFVYCKVCLELLDNIDYP